MLAVYELKLCFKAYCMCMSMTKNILIHIVFKTSHVLGQHKWRASCLIILKLTIGSLLECS